MAFEHMHNSITTLSQLSICLELFVVYDGTHKSTSQAPRLQCKWNDLGCPFGPRILDLPILASAATIITYVAPNVDMHMLRECTKSRSTKVQINWLTVDQHLKAVAIERELRHPRSSSTDMGLDTSAKTALAILGKSHRIQHLSDG